MNSDGSGMFQGTKCGSCGGFVGRRTKEQVIEQDQDKGYGICPKCEEQNEKHEEVIWNEWRNAVRDVLSVDGKEKWDSLNVDVQKAFVLQQLDLGNIKIGE